MDVASTNSICATGGQASAAAYYIVTGRLKLLCIANSWSEHGHLIRTTQADSQSRPNIQRGRQRDIESLLKKRHHPCVAGEAAQFQQDTKSSRLDETRSGLSVCFSFQRQGQEDLREEHQETRLRLTPRRKTGRWTLHATSHVSPSVSVSRGWNSPSQSG